MTTQNNHLWQTVIFLFLSKFIKQPGESFAEKLLINAKNVDLAARFAEMVGDTTPENKVKLTLIKATKKLEQTGFLQRIDDRTLQITDAGFSKMQSEVQVAMRKIAENFPQADSGQKPAPVMQ
ncbi:MAG: hypothetical protein JXR59_08620 [Desulfuromonadaceae bacterium]|nr:hypothetical protein [Desulfuromonadaceae bacterium]